MNKQIEPIKQIATELGIIFEDDAKGWQCTVKIPSAYYVTDGDYIEDPSTIYIFSVMTKNELQIVCFSII